MGPLSAVILLRIWPTCFRYSHRSNGLPVNLRPRGATQDDIKRIDTLTADLGQAVEAENRPRYFEINQAIHEAILSASGNETLRRTHATIAGRVHRARYQANLTPARWKTALEEHEQIADALKKREAVRLGRLLSDHLMAKLSSILSTLKPQDNDR